MIIIKSKELELELNKYLEIKSLNIDFVSMMLEILNECHDDINEENVFHEPGETVEKQYQNLLIHISGLNPKDNTEKFVIDNYLKNCVSILDTSKYQNNEYYKNIKINDCTYKNFEIKKINYTPYEMFFSFDINSDPNNYYLEKTSIGFFDTEYEFLALLENNVIWMLITPNEINTMKYAINEVDDNCLVLGLGLGYFPYMISLKENVKRITIVENNPDLIELFNNKILNQFKYKDKIKIVNDDAISYSKNHSKEYKYVFVDIFHDSIEAYKTIFDMKIIERENTNTKFIYWLKSGINAYARRCLLSLIESYYYNYKYQPENEIEESIITRFDQYYKNKLIDNTKNLKDILSDEEIENFLLYCN